MIELTIISWNLYKNACTFFAQAADILRENELAAKVAAEAAPVLGEFQTQKHFYGFAIHNTDRFSADPCEKINCGAGKVCEADGTSASCICIPECPQQSDPRRMVCTNRNVTWNSDCEVHRQRCLCDTNDSRCKSSDLKHIHINYYGQCKEMPV